MGFGAIGLVGSLASTGLQLYGMKQQAKAVTQAAEYNNALAQREAANREAETAQAITRERINQRSALSDLRNRLANSGLQTTTGTPQLLAGEAAGRFEIGIADAARAASMQAASLRAQGKMGLWEAATNKAATKTAMLATGISGVASAFGKYQEGAYQGLYPRIGKL
jgi:hypothetical protein